MTGKEDMMARRTDQHDRLAGGPRVAVNALAPRAATIGSRH